MDRLTDEFLSSTPDKHTIAWWRKQFQEVLKGYRGATHGINRLLAEFEDMAKERAELIQRLDSLEREREESNAVIGKLTERIERMAEFLNGLKTNGG